MHKASVRIPAFHAWPIVLVRFVNVIVYAWGEVKQFKKGQLEISVEYAG